VKDPKAVTLQQQIDDLDLLRHTLGIDKVTLVAHSMGTFLAFAYTQAHPDNVAGLILGAYIRE
jgi:proline iminopeptidase